MKTKRTSQSIALSAVIGLLALGAHAAPQAPSTGSVQVGKSPVKVFILAGQSNMDGQGAISGGKGSLEFVVKDPATAARYKHLVDKDGKWIVRDDVWCSYGDKGNLTVGGYATGGIGPELGIGLELGNYLDNQVLLVKVAVGGTSLAGPWRPPSSGGTTGWLYSNVVFGVKEQLQNLKVDFPGYDGKGYEIAGFCWHQGWNDGCNSGTAAEYEKNMVNFIKDVRKDLGLTNLPFVIGGSGFGGWDQKNTRRLCIMDAQKKAAEREEFKGNVLYVETRPFFRPKEVSPHAFGYHWNGNGETYYLIGEGMGKAMVELLGGPKAPANAVNPRPQKEKKRSSTPKAPVAVVKLPELTLDLGNKVTMKLLKIPAGKFKMGPSGHQREVTISKPFYMGQYEVTAEQFERFVKETGADWRKSEVSKRSDHPADRVCWDLAQEFCKWMSKKTGRTVTLPTEAQWEYACRAGSTTAYCFGDDADDLPDYAHFDMDGWDGSAKQSPQFAPVGSFLPNQWGLYDMHGNMNECCQDYSGDYSPTDTLDPKGPEKGGRRIMRGGSWSRGADDARSDARGTVRPGICGPREGLRVVVAE